MVADCPGDDVGVLGQPTAAGHPRVAQCRQGVEHLVRQPQKCYWLKAQTIDRPSRTILEGIRDAWITENGSISAGNTTEEAKWTQPIDAKVTMTADEQTRFASSEELTQSKILKNAARRVESQILSELESRGVKMQIRFNPKLKEKGLLDLK